jgi:multidrug efflux pump subunit AcrA (membrane-fusion protein)
MAIGCSSKPEGTETKSATPAPPIAVTTALVTARPIIRTIEAEGNLRGWEEVTIGNKRMGRVQKVYHDMGDRVKPGEALVELDPVDSDLAIAQAERSLTAQLEQVGLKELPTGKFDESKVPSVSQAQASLEKAQQNLMRERNVRARGAGSPQDLQNAEVDERVAVAALRNAEQAARASLAQAQVNKIMLDIAKQHRVDLTVRAPVPSVPLPGSSTSTTFAVAKRSVAEGQMVKDGEAVVQLVLDSTLRLWIGVGERYVNEVKVGQEVRITVPAFPGREFLGKVTRINPLVDASNRTFQVEAVVPNTDGMLHPGGFAKASIVLKRDDNSVTVPLLSVVTERGKSKLFLVSDDSKAREIEVTTGRAEKDWIEVFGKVPVGSKVVTTGQTKLFEGKAVVVRDPKPEAAESKPANKPAE